MYVYLILLFHLTAPFLIPNSINLTVDGYIPIIATMMLFAVNYNKITLLKDTKNEYRIFLLVFVITIILLIFDKFKGMSYLYGCLMSSAMFILIMKSNMDYKLVRNLFIGILIFFIVNSLMSYYERINMINLIPNRWQETWENDYHGVGLNYIFRSSALLGHPLTNAFSISILMCSILVMPIKSWIKYTLWGMGIISLLCFNARGATILSCTFLFIYILYETIKHPQFKKLLLVTCIICIFIYAFNIIINSPLAGRLVTSDLIDGSAQTRLTIWKPLEHMEVKELLIGFSQERYKEVCKLVKLNTMENWLAGFIYNMGIPFTVAFLIYYFKIYFRALKGLSLFSKMFMMFAFLSFAFLNNILSTSIVAWIWTYVVFILTSLMSNKKIAIKIIPKFLISKSALNK